MMPVPVTRALRTLSVAALMLLLAACASGPRLFVNSDPGAAFATYKTYDFIKPLDTDHDNYSSILSQYLRTSAARELEARGYRQSDHPDLLVNFHVQTQEKIQGTSSPAYPFGGYYGYRSGNYGVWGGYEDYVTQYTEGTLTVDIVDAARKQLVWEGTAVGRVTDKDRANLQPVIGGVVNQLFGKYPYRAP